MGITREEAFELMRQGKKMSHTLFTSDEWMIINDEGLIQFEDGIMISLETYNFGRAGKEWNDGYVIVE